MAPLRLKLLWVIAVALEACWCAPANALIVASDPATGGTTSRPADDPGWDYFTLGGNLGGGNANFVYLGDGWALSAFHVGPHGPPNPAGALQFSSGSFGFIPNQNFTVRNPTGMGLTEFTDLRLVRIKAEPPGLKSIFDPNPHFTLASQPILFTSQREVVIIGHGPTRLQNPSQWNATVNAGSNPPNDIWTEISGGAFDGYRGMYDINNNHDDTKRWGTNQIADEDPRQFPNGGSDNDLQMTVRLSLGVGPRDVVSMLTRFDKAADGGLTHEAQVVSGDSGSAVFHKRNGQWELIGIVNASLPPEATCPPLQSGNTCPTYSFFDQQPAGFAVYGDFTSFADLSFYHNNILAIMQANPHYSVTGDLNLDGIVNSADVASFVAGWNPAYSTGTGAGSLEAWKKGDIGRYVASAGDCSVANPSLYMGNNLCGVPDGKIDAADFLLLRNALLASGSGAILPPLSELVGGALVPEPSSVILAIFAAVPLSFRRFRRDGSAAH